MADNEIRYNINIEGNAEEALKKIKAQYDELKKVVNETNKPNGGGGTSGGGGGTAKPPTASIDPNITGGRNLIKELRESRQIMFSMIQAGDSTSDSFRNIQRRAGELRDQLDEVNARVKFFSSDTMKSDVAVAAIQTIGGAAQVAAGSMELLGINSKTAEESIASMVAIQSVLMGVLNVTKSLEKESPLMQGIAEIKLYAAAKAQALYTATVGSSTGALKSFKIALASTGIGAAVIGVGALVAVTASLIAKKRELIKLQEEEQQKNLENLKNVRADIAAQGDEIRKSKIAVYRAQGRDAEADQLETDYIKSNLEKLSSDLDKKQSELDKKNSEVRKTESRLANVTAMTESDDKVIRERGFKVLSEARREAESAKLASALIANERQSIENQIQLQKDALTITKSQQQNKNKDKATPKKEMVTAAAPKTFNVYINDIGRMEQVNIANSMDEKQLQTLMAGILLNSITTMQVASAK